MMEGNYLFTSESVSEGHPDKVCDIISDTVLDLCLSKDPQARVACETMTTTNRTVLAGELRVPESCMQSNGKQLSTDFKHEIEGAVRQAVKNIGYEQDGYHWNNMVVENHLHGQSPDIAMGVDAGDNKDEGAGDQGIMFGYACRDTDVLMPAAIHYSHKILQSLAEARHSGEASILGPDSKSQITLEHVNGQPVKATSVVVSTQHIEQASQEEIKELVRKHVISVLPDGWMCEENRFFVNPTGNFVVGGPDGDSGLTGRKIIVDTYGGSSPHGGGAFSGKDPTKVDRSAAYISRYMAKNVVAANLAEKCTIQLSYAIGVSEPLSLYVNTNNTGKISDQELSNILRKEVDLTPSGIRSKLGLNNSIYTPSASYGHFGRIPDEIVRGSFSWEKTDLIDKIS
ncbi:MAG: methionine adenosyltransferase [SAR116 cluster bacterium]|nr:methionine adenosyltransferase [SAR116 cluster bacterium]